MKPTISMLSVFALTGALAFPLAGHAQSTSSAQARVVLNASSGPLVLQFVDIDANKDGVISVTEGNEDVQSGAQRERSASAGGTAQPADKAPQPDAARRTPGN